MSYNSEFVPVGHSFKDFKVVPFYVHVRYGLLKRAIPTGASQPLSTPVQYKFSTAPAPGFWKALMSSPTLTEKVLKLVIASRPPSWIFGPILYGIGLIQSGKFPRSTRVLAVAALQVLSLSLPLSIIVFGVNDIYDFDSDSRNPRKVASGLQGGILEPEYHTFVRIGAYISTLFIIGVSLMMKRRSSILAASCLVTFGWQYSSYPLRLKEIPVLDSISNGLIVFLAWFYGFSFSGLGLLDVPGKGLMLSLCTAGIHALGAIIDVEADLAAEQNTIAIALGNRPTAAFAAICYLLAAYTEKPRSIFGVYLWVGALVMMVPCLQTELAQDAFQIIVYMSIICAVIWLAVRIRSTLKLL